MAQITYVVGYGEVVSRVEYERALAGKDAEIALLKIHSHKWTGRRMGGSPDNAESYEWARFCDYCGAEDTCDDDLPACPVTREDLSQQLASKGEEIARLREALAEIRQVASGEKQVAQDATEGMAWIDKRAALEAQ